MKKLNINRENTIKAILDYVHAPKEKLKKFHQMSDEDLLYVLDGFCSLCKHDFKEVLKKFDCISFDNITKDNIHLYYEFMSDEDIEKYKDVLLCKYESRLQDIFCRFWTKIGFIGNRQDFRKLHTIDNIKDGYITVWSIFGIKDTLKPIDEYIQEIKESSEYREYILNKQFDFITPNKRNEFISKWLKENNIKIELYNFKTEKESVTFDFDNAIDKLFGNGSTKRSSKDISLEIKELSLFEHSHTIPIDYGDIVIEKIKEYISTK